MIFDQPFFRRHALTMALVAGLLTFALWNIPQLDFILYPFRLFVTFIHEAGHSLMAEFTGGRVIEFTVFGNGAGVATTQGGNRLLILPAGYLGAAFFGAVLFYLTNTIPFPRKIALVVGTLMIVIALFFRATGIALVIGAFSGLGLVFVGLLTGLNAVFDLLFLVQNGHADLGGVPNDASAFAALTPVPTVIWALIWALLAAFMLGSAVWFSVVRPLRQREVV
jgi:hypothetical protein